MQSPGIQVDLPFGFDVHSPRFLASLAAASLSATTSSLSLEERLLHFRAENTPKLSATVKTGFARRAREGVKLAAPRSALVLVLIIEAHAYFVIALPWLWHNHVNRLMASALMVVLISRVLVGLVRVACIDPGRTTDVDSNLSATSRWPPHLQQLDGLIDWCNQCKASKPSRSHHCSTCQRCVLQMDHHCVFVNACVGQNNRQHFLMLLVDSVLALSLVQFTLLPPILDAAARAINGDDNPSQMAVSAAHLCTVFVLGSVVLYLSTGLLLFHLQLVLRNETTIEHLANAIERQKNPYDLGVLANFTEAFGCSPTFCPTGLLQEVLEALAWLLDGGSGWEVDIDWDSQQQPWQQQQQQQGG